MTSLLIAGGFVWALKRGGLPFAPPANAMANLRWWALPAFAALTLVANCLRAWRWIYLLRPLAPTLRPWRVFGIGLVGFSAIFFAPLRLGEVVRPYLMTRDGKVTLVQAVGTVAAERIIDGLTMVLMTAVALWLSVPLSPLPNHVGGLSIPVSLVPHTIWVATVMFTLAFAAMAAFYFARAQARHLVRLVAGLVSPRLADLGASVVEHLGESFGFLPSWQRAAPFLRNTVLCWLTSGVAYFVLLRGVGLSSSLQEAFVVLGVIGLGSLLPAGPGFFGAYQVATYTALAMYNSEHDVVSKGALAVFGSYVVHVLLNLLSGSFGLVVLSKTSAPSATTA